MQGVHGRRTGRVYGQAGAVEVMDIGDTVGNDAQIGACHAVGRCGADVVSMACAGIRRGSAHKDSRIRAGQAGGRDERILHGLPGQFQQQALLRVHDFGFLAGYAEKRRLKGIDMVQHARADTDRMAGHGAARMQKAGCIPAGGRHPADHVSPLGQYGPEAVQAVDAAGQAAGHADDGDGGSDARTHKAPLRDSAPAARAASRHCTKLRQSRN